MKKLTMAPPAVVPDKALIASVIFTVPPQGTASIGQADSVSISRYCFPSIPIVSAVAAAWRCI